MFREVVESVKIVVVIKIKGRVNNYPVRRKFIEKRGLYKHFAGRIRETSGVPRDVENKEGNRREDKETSETTEV